MENIDKPTFFYWIFLWCRPLFILPTLNFSNPFYSIPGKNSRIEHNMRFPIIFPLRSNLKNRKYHLKLLYVTQSLHHNSTHVQTRCNFIDPAIWLKMIWWKIFSWSDESNVLWTIDFTTLTERKNLHVNIEWHET